MQPEGTRLGAEILGTRVQPIKPGSVTSHAACLSASTIAFAGFFLAGEAHRGCLSLACSGGVVGMRIGTVLPTRASIVNSAGHTPMYFLVTSDTSGSDLFHLFSRLHHWPCLQSFLVDKSFQLRDTFWRERSVSLPDVSAE